MQPKDFLNLPLLARKSIKNFPRSWSQFSKEDLIQLNALAIIVGILAGYSAIGFRYLIGFLQNTILHDNWDYHLVSPLDHVRGLWMFLILPLGLLASALITKFFAPEAKGHGVPEVIEAVWRNGGKIRARIVAFKAFASSITIASGGSVGREGPIVQIGSALGSSIGQIMSLRPSLLKTLVGCGAAGAIAATFNTPIAGVIFAIEIIILELKTKSFVPLVISSVFATIISRAYLGNEPAFFVPEYSLTHPNELFFYLVLGILSGVVGVLFVRTLYFGEDTFDNLKLPFWTKPLLAGLILASIGYFYPSIYGVGYETISDALQQNSYFGVMLLLVFLKIICTTITISGGGSGGVFAPSLFIGAMLGGAFGHYMSELFPQYISGYGAYALVGMAAMFSATGKATFTAIVILFEMTLDYSIILPLMFACVLADQISTLIFKESIYSLKLRRKGLRIGSEFSMNIMSITPVKDIMTTVLHYAPEDISIEEAAKNLLQYDHSLYPVVSSDGQLTGVVTVKNLSKAAQKNPQDKITEITESTESIVDMNELVSVAVQKFANTRDPRILVINRSNNKLVGILSPVDLIRISSAE